MGEGYRPARHPATRRTCFFAADETEATVRRSAPSGADTAQGLADRRATVASVTVSARGNTGAGRRNFRLHLRVWRDARPMAPGAFSTARPSGWRFRVGIGAVLAESAPRARLFERVEDEALGLCSSWTQHPLSGRRPPVCSLGCTSVEGPWRGTKPREDRPSGAGNGGRWYVPPRGVKP